MSYCRVKHSILDQACLRIVASYSQEWAITNIIPSELLTPQESSFGFDFTYLASKHDTIDQEINICLVSYVTMATWLPQLTYLCPSAWVLWSQGSLHSHRHWARPAPAPPHPTPSPPHPHHHLPTPAQPVYFLLPRSPSSEPGLWVTLTLEYQFQQDISPDQALIKAPGPAHGGLAVQEPPFLAGWLILACIIYFGTPIPAAK